MASVTPISEEAELAPQQASPARSGCRSNVAAWEEACLASPAPIRNLLLDQARRRGLLVDVDGGAWPRTPSLSIAENRQRWLDLLTKDDAGRAPLIGAAVDFCDAELDAIQRDTVRRALCTPDVFLLQGLPGTGKSRVVSEIVAQSARRGERVLLSAASAASLDSVLSRMGRQSGVVAIRCLGPCEKAEDVPPASREFTIGERHRQLSAEPLQAARLELADAERRCERTRQVLSALQKLEELARRLIALQAQEEEFRRQCEEEAATVRREAEPPETAQAPAGQLERRNARTRLQALQREEDHLRSRLDVLESVRGRWWTLAWWQALRLDGAALADRLERIHAERAAQENECRRLDEEQAAAERNLREERERHIEAEVARRLARLAEGSKPQSSEHAAVRAEWDRLGAAVEPHRCQPAGVPAALSACRHELARAEQQLAFARAWLTCVEESKRASLERLVRGANVVAVTAETLAADMNLGEAAELSFDLLVLLDADRFSKCELVELTSRAPRWVMVGRTEARPIDSGESNGNGAHAESAPGAPSFAELWQRLHSAPRQLPVAWIQDGNRLLCRLRAVLPEQRQWLECERLADFPEVELRILSLPRTKPVLAEVAFPSSVAIERAKTYLYRELDELPVAAKGNSLYWTEDEEKLVLHLGPDASTPLAIDLGAGVRELIERDVVGSNGDTAICWSTSRLEFERRAGWDRPRAIDWVKRHVGLQDGGRTAWLDVPYRMHRDIACFIADVLLAESYGSAGRDGAANGHAAAVEFVSVGTPPTASGSNGKNGKRPTSKSARAMELPKTGTGLELDLSDHRQRERLASELRDVGERGIVNLPEAQAVIRTLERLASEAGATSGVKRRIAVTSLQAGQVSLIRRLARQSRVLVQAGFELIVALPAELKAREFDVVLVSLARSHGGKAVPFSNNGDDWVQALTRARSKLILFGDPGTLARRSQWTAALAPLDAVAAARERDIVSHLVRYLAGSAAHPGIFCWRKG